MKHVAPKQRRKSVVWTILGILAELMLTAAAVCALYIAWQMWWTGVQAEHNQIETRQSVSWSDPGQSDSVTIAQAQEGDPPTQPQSAQEGELIAQVYIPRFGSQWQRNLVEGTSLTELNKHGLGHYKDSQMPGQVGNFAFAGHRNGYGQPLGDVDKLQEGDPIIVRTQDYWYVYHYTSYKIVLPTDIEVVAANPENPGATPTKLPERSTTKATPILAPELMPSTDGPAKGLRKTVCICKPLTESPAPATNAVSACGTRDFQIIFCQITDSFPVPQRIFHTARSGMETEPNTRFRKKNRKIEAIISSI